MEYKPTSSILVLTICSLDKERYGQLEYEKNNSISNLLSNDLAKRLYTRRERIRNEILKNSSLTWANTSINDAIYNEDLISGKDFNGDNAALYLPAITRYSGRFYNAVGKYRSETLSNSKHHFLILSGLYGLLRPFEPIQLYSCPLVPRIQEIWNEDNLLTEILNTYIKINDIQYIFDFTALDNYRSLIQWDSLKPPSLIRFRGIDIMAPNDQALIHFGEYVRDNLLPMPEEKIKEVKVNKIYLGTIKFISKSKPHSGLPIRRNIDTPRKKEPVIPKSSRVGKRDELIEEATMMNMVVKAFSSRHWNFSFDSQFTQEYENRIQNDKELGAALFHGLIDMSKHPFQTSDNSIKRLSTGKYEYRWRKYRMIYDIDIDSRSIIINKFGTHNDSDQILHQ